MPAGVAFDGSPWVTAASSVGLVVASVGLAVAGGAVIARKAIDGALGPPGEVQQQAPDTTQRSRSMPLSKSAERSPTEMPPPADSVDVKEP